MSKNIGIWRHSELEAAACFPLIMAATTARLAVLSMLILANPRGWGAMGTAKATSGGPATVNMPLTSAPGLGMGPQLTRLRGGRGGKKAKSRSQSRPRSAEQRSRGRGFTRSRARGREVAPGSDRTTRKEIHTQHRSAKYAPNSRQQDALPSNTTREGAPTLASKYACAPKARCESSTHEETPMTHASAKDDDRAAELKPGATAVTETRDVGEASKDEMVKVGPLCAVSSHPNVTLLSLPSVVTWWGDAASVVVVRNDRGKSRNTCSEADEGAEWIIFLDGASSLPSVVTWRDAAPLATANGWTHRWCEYVPQPIYDKSASCEQWLRKKLQSLWNPELAIAASQNADEPSCGGTVGMLRDMFAKFADNMFQIHAGPSRMKLEDWNTALNSLQSSVNGIIEGLEGLCTSRYGKMSSMMGKIVEADALDSACLPSVEHAWHIAVDGDAGWGTRLRDGFQRSDRTWHSLPSVVTWAGRSSACGKESHSGVLRCDELAMRWSSMPSVVGSVYPVVMHDWLCTFLHVCA